jgi:DNA-binding NtrC family response regulator
MHDEGYRFTLTADAAAMRAHLAKDAYDIVMIDVSLRSGDGFTLAAEAADHGAGVILTTGDRRLFENVEKSGHRYLMKPFMADGLVDLVRQVLQETEARCVRRKRAAAL